MAQTVFLGKDIYFAIGPDGGAKTVVSGIGNGLRSVRFSDPALIEAKAGTGNYQELYDTEKRRPTCTAATQLGTVIEPAFVGKHGELQEVDFGKRGNAAGDPKVTFKCFIVEPEIPYNTEADGIDADFELRISGAPVPGQF